MSRSCLEPGEAEPQARPPTAEETDLVARAPPPESMGPPCRHGGERGRGRAGNGKRGRAVNGEGEFCSLMMVNDAGGARIQVAWCHHALTLVLVVSLT
jgi:hypothetical protein